MEGEVRKGYVGRVGEGKVFRKGSKKEKKNRRKRSKVVSKKNKTDI